MISLALVLYLLSRQGWSAIWQSVQSIPLPYFLIAILLMLISRLTVVGRWYALLRGADQALTFQTTARLVFAGLFATNFLPTTIGGDVIRLAGAVKRRLSPPVVTASLLADRLIGVIGMTTLLPVGLPYLLAVHETGFIREPLLYMAAIGTKNKIMNWYGKARNFVTATLKALTIWFKRPSSLIFALLWTYGHQIALFTTIWVLFMGMGQTISWWGVAGLWIFNYYITLLPVSINGLGVQELTIAYIYSQFGGVSPESALVMAIIIRLLYMLVSLPGALALPEILSSDQVQSPGP
jgi:uncharacterized membrane protein YbhN (UPF0104 family)